MALHKPYEIFYYDSTRIGFNSSIIRCDCEEFRSRSIAILSLSRAFGNQFEHTGDEAFLSTASFVLLSNRM